jgi:hypothetical protein
VRDCSDAGTQRAINRLGAAREYDDGGTGRERRPVEAAEGRVAIHLGHHDVKKDEIRSLAPHPLDHLGAVGGDLRAIPGRVEYLAEHIAKCRLIIGDQHKGRTPERADRRQVRLRACGHHEPVVLPSRPRVRPTFATPTLIQHVLEDYSTVANAPIPDEPGAGRPPTALQGLEDLRPIALHHDQVARHARTM